MLLLPYPISTNRYWRNFRGRMVRSSAAIEYKDLVTALATESLMAMHLVPVSVRMVLHPERPADWEKRSRKDPMWALKVRRIDIDNAQKVALDALQGVVFENDRQVTSLSIELGDPIPGGGLSVTIEPDKKWSTQ